MADGYDQLAFFFGQDVSVLMQQSGLFDQDRINLSGYVAGTYFLKIMTTEGSREIRVTKQ